jgi:hypothetical protein
MPEVQYNMSINPMIPVTEPLLEQIRFGLIRKRFRLTGKGVVCSTRTLFSRNEFTIPYETLPEHPFTATASSRIAFWFFSCLLFLGTLTLLFSRMDPQSNLLTSVADLVAAAAFGVIFLVSRRRYIGYNCMGKVILFSPENPSAEEVEEFLRLMGQRRLERLRRSGTIMYTTVMTDNLEKIARLHRIGSLSDAEYERLKVAFVEQMSPPEISNRFRYN